MQLVLANAQSELAPLEIGVHALEAVELGIGGKGKKGGLSSYAEAIGKTQGYITQVRQAAEVFKAIKPITQVIGFLDKAKHLAAIHGADKKLWPLLVRQMFKHSWTVTDTEHWVSQVTAASLSPFPLSLTLPTHFVRLRSAALRSVVN